MVVTYSLKPTAQDTGHLRSVWKTIDAASCPRSYNFHLHTIASDGKLTPVDLMQQAIAIGLKGLAITDHHSVAGFQEAASYLATLGLEQKNLPQLWTGTEITSQLLAVEVHILGYGFDPEHPAIGLYLHGDKPLEKAAQAERVIESIHRAGGLAVLAHPERYRRSASQLIPAAAELNIDGVETYYAYNNPQIWRPSPGKTELVQALAAKYHLYSTCGTDTHGVNILQRL
jgi:predicted metal-dependent phosphoesterase TrpH